jgi:hypothetical protein
MKGDRTEIVIDAGGSTLTYEIEATRNGRRVEITHGRGAVAERRCVPLGSWPPESLLSSSIPRPDR